MSENKYKRKRRSRYLTGEDIDMFREREQERRQKRQQNICDTHIDVDIRDDGSSAMLDEKMFDFQHITLAPILVLLGFVVEIVAIFWRKKK